MTLSALTNVSAMTTQRYLEINTYKAARASEALASGSRIAKSVYDPSSAAIAAGLTNTIESLVQASRNTSEAMSMVQMASGILDSQSAILTRMQSLAVQANNTSNTAAQNAAFNGEYQQLLTQLNTNATMASQWNNVALLGGGAGAVTPVGSVAQGAASLVAVANAFAGTLNGAGSAGFINGVVSSATVTSNGAGAYNVSVVVGGQTFQANAVNPVGGGSLNLTSTTDPTAVISLNYAAAVTAITNATTFQSSLQTLLGIGTASLAVFTANSAAVPATWAISDSGATTSGSYTVSYTGASAGNTGSFYLSNGTQTWTANVTTAASMTQTVTFNNGVSIALTAFNGTGNQAQVGFNVAPGSGVTSTFQIGALAADTLSINFAPVTPTALLLNGTNLTTAGNAQTANGLLTTAIQTVSSIQATIGGQYDQLQYMYDAQNVSIQNNKAAKSVFADADISQSMADASKYKALASAANFVLTQTLQENAAWARMVQSL